MSTPTTWEEAAARAAENLKLDQCKDDGPETYFEHLLNYVRSDVDHLIKSQVEGEDDIPDRHVLVAHSAYEWLLHNTDWNLDAILELVANRHAKYGPGNITRFKFLGLTIRMNDKVERLQNGSVEFDDEKVEDTWVDLVGYSIIWQMLLDGTFELPLEKDVVHDHVSAEQTNHIEDGIKDSDLKFWKEYVTSIWVGETEFVRAKAI